MIGFLLAIAGAALFGLTITIQKYSLGEQKKFDLKTMASNKKWLSSILIGAIGGVMYVQALSMEQLSTVQPLMSSISMLVPVLIGAFVFREKMGGIKWLLVGMLIIGIFILGF